MLSQLFAKKSVESLLKEVSGSGSASLERSLNIFTLTALGIGAIIGAGIFVITGEVVAAHTGPSIIISFTLAALGCSCVGLCYAEFASLIPVAGSAYSYAYVTLGELLAWIVGWDLVLEYLFGIAIVAVGWSGYMVSFLEDFGIVLPDSISHAPCNVPAVVLVTLMTGLLVIGIRKSTKFNNAIVAIKVGTLLLFIAFGIAWIDPQNWIPFIPENTGEFGKFGWSGIVQGTGIIFFSYLGFDALSSASQEAHQPQRDIPIAILVALGISTLLYICVALVLTGIVPYTQLDVPDPIALGVKAMGIGFRWLQFVVKLAAIAGLSSVVLVSLMAQARVVYAMARDGLLPSHFAQVHPKFKTPYIATIGSGIFAIAFAGLLPMEVLSELVSIGTLLAFLIVTIAVLVLRYTQPNLNRPFRTPLMPWLPLLGAGWSAGQMLCFSLNNWIRLLSWLLIGLAIYFFYGRHRSIVHLENQIDLNESQEQFE